MPLPFISDTFGIGSAMIILCAKSLFLLTSTIKRWSRRSRLSLSIISRISTWAQDKGHLTWAQDELYSSPDKKKDKHNIGSTKNIKHLTSKANKIIMTSFLGLFLLGPRRPVCPTQVGAGGRAGMNNYCIHKTTSIYPKCMCTH